MEDYYDRAESEDEHTPACLAFQAEQAMNMRRGIWIDAAIARLRCHAATLNPAFCVKDSTTVADEVLAAFDDRFPEIKETALGE